MGSTFDAVAAKHYGECSDMLGFLKERNRKTVQTAETTTVVAEYCRFERCIFSTGGSPLLTL